MDTPLRVLIAKRIYEVLERKKLRQRDLPELTGLSRQQISRILKGYITVDNIDLLERKLNCKILRVETVIDDFRRDGLSKSLKN